MQIYMQFDVFNPMVFITVNKLSEILNQLFQMCIKKKIFSMMYVYPRHFIWTIAYT